MQLLHLGTFTRDEHLGMTMKQNYSAELAISQEQGTLSSAQSTEYVIITTAHNEEEFIGRTIKRALNQNIKPSAYVVVDDSSTDGTLDKIRKYPVIGIRINEPRLPYAYLNRRRAFAIGAKIATKVCPDWKFLLKVDADSIIPRDYFARIYHYMSKYPEIGICSGVWRGGKVWKSRSSNGAIVYRRECWDDIERFHPIPAWDTHAILKAYHKGWKSMAIPQLIYEELRTSERTKLREWYETGQARFLQGFPLYHTFGVGVIHCRKKPPLLGSVVMVLTHLLYILCRRRKPFSEDYYKFIKDFSWWEVKIRFNLKSLLIDRIMVNNMHGKAEVEIS